MITVDKLRKMGGYPHYLGLGVVKCRIGHKEGYHFFSDRSPVLVDQIHEHRFGFHSTVLKGILKTIIFVPDGQNPNSTWQIERGECRGGAEREITLANAKMKELCWFTTGVGESYNIEYDTFHQIELVTPKVITHVIKEPFSQDAPQFVVDASEPRVCAFSKPKSQAECWEIIDYTIND